jgi:hypothetical protein
MPMETHFGHDPANFYVWRVSEAFAIHLSLKMVAQLSVQISRSGSDNQAAETLGILLGRTTDTPLRATVIEDFKLVSIGENRALHAGSEDELFEDACRMIEPGSELRPLGFFRAGWGGNLNLAPRDLQTFRRLFAQTGNIALLIQTPQRGKASEAALFYWQHGTAQPRDFGLGFPFDASQLASGDPGWRYANPIDRVQPSAGTLPAQPRAPVPMPTPAPASSVAGSGIRWSRLMLTAALAVIGVGAVQMATNSNHTVAAAPAESSATPNMVAPGETAPDNQHGLGLTVTTRQHQLEIRWNRESGAIAGCDKGVMRITDDGITEAVPFDQGQLRDGYVAYTPKTNDVSIRLEVTGKDGGTTSESIRAVAIP